MKKIIFTIAAIMLLISVTNAQKLTAIELIKQADCIDFECFNGYITGKGFSFDNVDTTGRQKIYTFLSDKFNEGETLKMKNVATINIASGAYTNVSIGTTSKQYYQQMLKEFKSMGFVSKLTENKGDRVTVSYRSDRYKKIFMRLTIAKSKADSIECTTYDFEVCSIAI